jgi:hypothetical protein
MVLGVRVACVYVILPTLFQMLPPTYLRLSYPLIAELLLTHYQLHLPLLAYQQQQQQPTMPGQHDTTPIQTVIYKPNEHADEYIVAIDDVAEASPYSSLLSPCLLFIPTLITPDGLEQH